MKIGRNESCPCGSGKKYKVCCGAASDTEAPQILASRRLNRAVEEHAPKLLSFIANPMPRGQSRDGGQLNIDSSQTTKSL